MELDADAVTSDIADDAVTVLFRQIVDSLSHVAQIAPRLNLLQTRLDALKRDLDELLLFRRGFSDY